MDLNTLAEDQFTKPKTVSRNKQSKFHTIEPQPIANISTNGKGGVGNFNEPKQKVQAILSTIDNIQNAPSIDYMPTVDHDSDNELVDELFDDYLRMEKSRHAQEFML